MSKKYYAIRAVVERIETHSFPTYNIKGYIADTVEIKQKLQKINYKDNEPLYESMETLSIEVCYPRISNVCFELTELNENEIFNSYKECLNQAKKFNEELYTQLNSYLAEGKDVLDAEKCKQEVEAEQQLANEYMNNNTLNV